MLKMALEICQSIDTENKTDECNQSLMASDSDFEDLLASFGTSFPHNLHKGSHPLPNIKL